MKIARSLSYLLLISVVVYFWPAQLYGSTHYIAIFGSSMLPSVQTGSLAIVKPKQSYNLGDVVAYVEEEGAVTFVHRIIGIFPEGFTTKGDNNAGPDSGPIPKERVLGEAILIVPLLGLLGAAVRTPIGIAVFFVLMAIAFGGRSAIKSSSRMNERKYFGLVVGSNFVNYLISALQGFSLTFLNPIAQRLTPFLGAPYAATVAFIMIFLSLLAYRIISPSGDRWQGTINVYVTMLLLWLSIIPFIRTGEVTIEQPF